MIYNYDMEKCTNSNMKNIVVENIKVNGNVYLLDDVFFYTKKDLQKQLTLYNLSKLNNATINGDIYIPKSIYCYDIMINDINTGEQYYNKDNNINNDIFLNNNLVILNEIKCSNNIFYYYNKRKFQNKKRKSKLNILINKIK